VIRSIWAIGAEIRKEVVFLTDDEQEALVEECRRIATFPKGTLTNHTLGGDGTAGRTPSDDTKAKIADAHRGKTLSEEHRRKVSEGLKAHYSDPVNRERIGASQRGKKRDPQVGQQIAESLRGKSKSEEHRQHLSEARQGRIFGPLTPEHRARLSAAKTGHPGAFLGRTFSEEHRRHLAENKRRWWAARRFARQEPLDLGLPAGDDHPPG
jgi:hypothetical protein